ncbi:hypothetical protein U1Q18_019163, partial [Sarracenia purpurea var. burkii]
YGPWLRVKAFQRSVKESRSPNKGESASIAQGSSENGATNRKKSSGKDYLEPTSVSSLERVLTRKMERANQTDNQLETRPIMEGRINMEDRKGESFLRKGNDEERHTKSTFGNLVIPKPILARPKPVNHLRTHGILEEDLTDSRVNGAEPNTCVGLMNPAISGPKDTTSRNDPEPVYYLNQNSRDDGATKFLGLGVGNTEQERQMSPNPLQGAKSMSERGKQRARGGAKPLIHKKAHRKGGGTKLHKRVRRNTVKRRRRDAKDGVSSPKHKKDQ